jgi:hypothetical protein
MSVSIPEDIQGLDQASAELDRLMAADAAADSQGQAKPQTQESATDEAQRAAQTGEQQAQAAPKESGAAAEQKTDPNPKTEVLADGQKPKTQAPKEEAKSRYQKAVERQEKSWSELNAQKEALKREREEFDRVKTEHEQAKAKEEEQFSPEAYESAAKKFEEAGKFDLAELAREKAKQLRDNPKAPSGKTQGPKQDPQEPARKEWALKAGVDFPELAKTNSPLQVRVAQLLKEEPDLKAHPKGIYLAARLADLETRANGVAAKDKELSELRAKVKELEGLTSPGGGGAQRLPAARAFSDLSDDEQFEQLKREAQEVGNLR